MQQSLSAIAESFQQGIDKHPFILANIFWSLFTGVVLWESGKTIINEGTDNLKKRLQNTLNLFLRVLPLLIYFFCINIPNTVTEDKRSTDKL